MESPYTARGRLKSFVTNLVGRGNRRGLICALLLFAFVFFFERAVFRVNYREFLSYSFSISKSEFSFYLVFVCVSLLSIILFFYISLMASWKYKVVYFLIFLSAVGFEYGYQKAFGRFSYYLDLQIAALTTTEQKMTAVGAYFNLFALVPAITYGIMLLAIKPRSSPYRTKSFAALGILSVSLCAGYWYLGATGNSSFYNYPGLSLTTFARTVTSYALFRTLSRRQPRDRVEAPTLPDAYLPTNNIVLIVDESVRSDHLSLNGYSRATTPFLSQLARQGLIQNWGMAVSGSTCSLISHDFLITGLEPESVSDGREKIQQAPLIFQYAKAMRYQTHYFDGQMNTLWGEMEGQGVTYVDNWLGAVHFDNRAQLAWDIDFEIAKEVNRIISSSRGNFIFIFKRGIHIPYDRSFPSNERVWEPSFSGRRFNEASASPAAINAYDNAIKYNLDGFFQRLATDYHVLRGNNVIVYTSDHGQSLGEGGVQHSHCGDTQKEAMVPLFMVGGPTDVDLSFKPTHANLFATLLDLMNYPERLRRHQYAISLLRAKGADSRQRYFVSSARQDRRWTTSHAIKFDEN